MKKKLAIVGVPSNEGMDVWAVSLDGDKGFTFSSFFWSGIGEPVLLWRDHPFETNPNFVTTSILQGRSGGGLSDLFPFV